ncbi:MAG: ROK family protein [Acidimicrobiia bacterium]|nr:MAG: ROK family protein [Acidimicrobiia bacterium]
MTALGIDIGGSGIKGALVDFTHGMLIGTRLRIPTPDPSTPGALVSATLDLVNQHDWQGPIGIAVPGVVRDGVVRTAANIDDAWIGLDAAAMFSEALGRPVTILNDADSAGLAEARYGAGAGIRGVVLLLTFGTGIGSALMNNGVLVPNTEFGHLEFRGSSAEAYAAARLVKRDSMTIGWWAQRVNELLAYVEILLSPDRVIIGGGISKRFEEFAHLLDTVAEVVPAQLRNNAGIVGAALAAREDGS